jgi:hypothetical protein
MTFHVSRDSRHPQGIRLRESETQPPRQESDLCCTVYDPQCICSVTCSGCRCRCKGCSCGPLVWRPRQERS